MSTMSIINTSTVRSGTEANLMRTSIGMSLFDTIILTSPTSITNIGMVELPEDAIHASSGGVTRLKAR